MNTRPATPDDVAAVTELRRRADVAWFGAAEHDADEIAEELELATHSRLLLDGDRLVAAAFRFTTDAGITVDPDLAATPVYDEVLPWLESVDAVQIDVLDRDTELRAAVESRGWTYRYSAFDMRRAYDEGWTPDEPRWADGVDVRDFRAVDAQAVHHLVYVDARFADEPGHFPRDFTEWQGLFLAGRSDDELPLLAWRGDRLVGAAVGRDFSDGTGWINQLAVSQDERGTGIGTALMAAYFARRRELGATSAGLGVMASNRSALRLYQRFGLEIDREYRFYGPPAR